MVYKHWWSPWLEAARGWKMVYWELVPHCSLFRPDRIATLVIVLAMLAILEGVRWLLT